MTEAAGVLTLIALWCGSPAYLRLSSEQVNQCRQNLIKCNLSIAYLTQDSKGVFSTPVQTMSFNDACFIKEKLP